MVVSSPREVPTMTYPQHPVAPPPPTPPPLPPRRTHGLFVFVAVVAVALAAGVGYQVAADRRSGTQSSFGLPQGTVTERSGSVPADVDVESIARSVAPSIVNVNTSLATGGVAAGSGIVISSSGLVLTNNHVIANALDIEVENAGTGSTHRATVLGYDLVDDVAVLRLDGSPRTAAAPIGDASRVSIGDTVIGLGNGGGRGGAPAVAVGTVSALDRSIVASDPDGSSAEHLSHLIQTDAPIQPGDSGGPLVDVSGSVVGVNTAASTGNARFGGFRPSAQEGYAIPIQDALRIARSIVDRKGGETIHVGAHRGLLGISVLDDGTQRGDGAYVRGVEPGSGADDVGIGEGALVVGIDGTSVSSASQLTQVMVPYQPRDRVKVTWVDRSGSTHRATVVLGSGPPA